MTEKPDPVNEPRPAFRWTDAEDDDEIRTAKTAGKPTMNDFMKDFFVQDTEEVRTARTAGKPKNYFFVHDFGCCISAHAAKSTLEDLVAHPPSWWLEKVEVIDGPVLWRQGNDYDNLPTDPDCDECQDGDEYEDPQVAP